MTKLLLKLFIKNSDEPRNPRVRSAVGKLSGVVGILCNLVLFAIKLTAGLLSGAVAITADALNSLSDGISSGVTLLGFRLAEIPPDEKHPFGHARFEYLAGLAVSVLVMVIGMELTWKSVLKILHPEPAEFSLPVAAILLASLLLKLWMSAFQRKLGKYIDSRALLASGTDSRNDCIATGAVLLAACLEKWTGWRLDGWFGLAVALFILWSGVDLAKDTVSPLLGEGAAPELREQIVDYIQKNPLVLGYHDLMVHDYGPGQRFASIHVEMDYREDPLVCHEAIDDMERECMKSHGIHLVIHYDPTITNDPLLNHLHRVADRLLGAYDPRISTHDFSMVKGQGHSNLIFDVVLPADLMGKRDEIRKTLETGFRKENSGNWMLVLNFDQAACR